MTVGELITMLQTLPDALPVVVNMDRNELANSRVVRLVEVLEAQERLSDGNPTGSYTCHGWDADEWIGTPQLVVSIRT